MQEGTTDADGIDQLSDNDSNLGRYPSDSDDDDDSEKNPGCTVTEAEQNALVEDKIPSNAGASSTLTAEQRARTCRNGTHPRPRRAPRHRPRHPGARALPPPAPSPRPFCPPWLSRLNSPPPALRGPHCESQ